MRNTLATLGQFRLGVTEYNTGRARTQNSWHMVRKQYGQDSTTYSYARFNNEADYLAARKNPDLATWADEPYSDYDYTLLLLPMATPLPTSTPTAGATPSASAGGGTQDSSQIVNAISVTNDKLTQMLTSQQGTSTRATEATLAKVAAALAGTLTVGIDGEVTIANLPDKYWLDTQPVSGTFWQATQPVSLASAPLATGAATQAGQDAAATVLQAINTKLGGTLTVNFPTTQAVSLATNTPDVTDRANRQLGRVSIDSFGGLTDTQLRAAPVPVSGFPTTYPVTGTFWPATQPVSGPVTDAQLRATPLPVSGFPATQPVSATALPLPTGAATEVTLAKVLTNTLTVALPSGASTAALQTALNNSVATAAKQDAIITALGPLSTAALQTTGNAALAAIQANTAALAPGASTAALQTAGNTLLQTIATNTSTPGTVSFAPRTSGGLSQRTVITNAGTTLAPSTTPTVIKATAGQVYSIDAFNESTSKRYLNLYNKATAPVATDVPVAVFVLFPGVALPHIDYGSLGSAYSNGIALTVTANNGLVGSLTSLLTGLTTANEVTVNVAFA